MINRLMIGLSLCLMVSTTWATDQIVVWQRTPITIILPVGKERLVSFPERVTLGYNPNRLTSNKLRIQNDHHTLYLLAKQPFSAIRVVAKLTHGQAILFNISAKKVAPDNPIDIVLPSNNASKADSVDHNHVDYVTLMRFALHQLYAPSNLLDISNHITRFPMDTTHVVPLMMDQSSLAMPLASWKGAALYVTAILLKNLLLGSHTLSPDMLCGHWQAAAFYPYSTLGAKHDEKLSRQTTLFLISGEPFSQAISDCYH